MSGQHAGVPAEAKQKLATAGLTRRLSGRCARWGRRQVCRVATVETPKVQQNEHQQQSYDSSRSAGLANEPAVPFQAHAPKLPHRVRQQSGRCCAAAWLCLTELVLVITAMDVLVAVTAMGVFVCWLQVLLSLGRAMWCAMSAGQAASHPDSSTSSSRAAQTTGEQSHINAQITAAAAAAAPWLSIAFGTASHDCRWRASTKPSAEAAAIGGSGACVAASVMHP
jgi:hypothetical protein